MSVRRIWSKKLTRRWAGVVLLAIVLQAGCSKATETVRGVAPAAEATTTVRQLAKLPASGKVVLSGEMTEKCPIAGCWFMLRDKTGIVRVDTKAAGFVVSDVPVHTQMTVVGRVVPGSEPSVSATGLQF